MENFKNRRDAILETATIDSESDKLIFMARMVKTMKAGTLSKLDCDMIADSFEKRV